MWAVFEKQRNGTWIKVTSDFADKDEADLVCGNMLLGLRHGEEPDKYEVRKVS